MFRILVTVAWALGFSPRLISIFVKRSSVGSTGGGRALGRYPLCTGVCGEVPSPSTMALVEVDPGVDGAEDDSNIDLSAENPDEEASGWAFPPCLCGDTVENALNAPRVESIDDRSAIVVGQ